MKKWNNVLYNNQNEVYYIGDNLKEQNINGYSKIIDNKSTMIEANVSNVNNWAQWNNVKYNNKLDVYYNDNTYELVKSLNNLSNINNNTKVVIVGTLTPPAGMTNGYFYSASRNKVYSTIDKWAEQKGKMTNSLVNLKSQLKNKPKDITIINQIKYVLNNYNIAFLDVVDEAVRKKGNSADEFVFTPANKDFQNLQHINRFICTSKNASDVLISMGISQTKLVICHQDRFHYNYNNWFNALP